MGRHFVAAASSLGKSAQEFCRAAAQSLHSRSSAWGTRSALNWTLAPVGVETICNALRVPQSAPPRHGNCAERVSSCQSPNALYLQRTSHVRRSPRKRPGRSHAPARSGPDLVKKKKKITSFGQPTSLIARGRASATLPNVIHLCQTKCQ